MYKKNIEHLVTVSLKYFFDLDYSALSHTFVIFILVFAVGKLVFANVKNMAADTFNKVKLTVLNIKSRWNGAEDVNFPTYTNSHIRKDITAWKLK